VPYLAFQPDAMIDTPILPMAEITTSYYLRIRVADKLGVVADITRILADAAISIDAMLQKEPAVGETEADIIILTHHTQEKKALQAIATIEALSTVSGKVARIRLEELG
jgi:homoserine dehydrogenase